MDLKTLMQLRICRVQDADNYHGTPALRMIEYEVRLSLSSKFRETQAYRKAAAIGDAR
jgi:hypothetical protein